MMRFAAVLYLSILPGPGAPSLSAAPQGRSQEAQDPDANLFAKLKQKEVLRVINVLRQYATSRRPDLVPLLDSVQLIVPRAAGSDVNASAYRWGRSSIVSINYNLLLAFLVFAELSTAFETHHPEAETAYKQTVVEYEWYLRQRSTRAVGLPWVIYSTRRRYIPDDGISTIAEALRHDIIAWAVLHEISHHILGHTAIDAGTLSLSASRKLELEADVSAFSLSNALGLSLTNLKAFFELQARLEPLLIKHHQEPEEAKSDHPSWATRLRTLTAYMEQHPPPRSAWVAFGADKFVKDERLAGTGLSPYRISSFHYIIPDDPITWANLGFDAIWEASSEFHLSAEDPLLDPVAVSLENGQMNLYSRSDTFLTHVVIASPHDVSSHRTVTMTVVSTGEPHTGNSIVFRDSAFRWETGPSVGGVSLRDFQSSPPKDVILKIVRSMVQVPTLLRPIERSVTNLLRSDGAAYLAYMKGDITTDEYSQSVVHAYQTMAGDLRMILGDEIAAELVTRILDTPYCKVREIRKELVHTP